MWYEERVNKAKTAVNASFSLCCQEGKVLLPKFKETPLPLKTLLDYEDPTGTRFRDQIRVYNGMFNFTSFGARIDHSINRGRGLYTFRINGQNYHLTGSLLPKEARNRMSAFIDKETVNQVDESVIASLITMLEETSAVAKAFRMARDWCHSHGSSNFELRLLSERKKARQYNAPTVSEVAALITNDFGDGITTRDIIVNCKNTGANRISEFHPPYMALQYPLLFPYRDDGYHEKIPYHTNTGSRKTKRGYVSMKEYYAYLIQQRNNQGSTLVRGGRLFQQFFVDAYTAIEEQIVKWNQHNQDDLRVDLYHNLQDAVTRGDTDAAGLGKRIVLPSSLQAAQGI